VFAGGFTLAAAEAVADHSHVEHGPPHVVTESVLDSLAVLITSSLIERRDDPGGEPRFSLLETVREFALEQLVVAGEGDATRSAHADFYLTMMEQTESVLWASANKTVLDEIEIEHDNLRAALTWSLADEPETALRLAGALGQFWAKRSYWVEGRSWLGRALATGVMAGTRERALALGRTAAIAAIKGTTRKRHGTSKCVWPLRSGWVK
jgi:predicted ATPase